MMQPFNGDLKQALKWLQNKAPNIESMITQKAAWYDQHNTQFWSTWQTNVFDLRKATAFGCFVWCIILGVPSQIFGLYPVNRAWAYGNQRQNFVYKDVTNPVPTAIVINQVAMVLEGEVDPEPQIDDPNLIGGNFYGGGFSTILSIDEVRKALRLRYVALVSNGNIKFINYMLNYIFNDGQPWDYDSGRYFYVADCTFVGQTHEDNPPFDDPFLLEYRIGPGMNLSGQFINVMNNDQYGIAPRSAGARAVTKQES